MDGIGIQILDGIENKTLHYPDGRSKRRQRRSMLANFTPSQREEFSKQTRGITARIADDTDTVVKGLDFAGFAGSGSIDDDEMAYNYLLRTKNIVDNSPQVIAGYTNPGLFSQMLGYVIENWDTANREGAIIRMANEENKLIEKGELQPEEGEYEYLSADESINIDDFIVAKSGMVKKKASKNGFFNNLKKTTTASITGDIAEVVASNPLLYKRKNRIRKATQSSRTNKNKLVATAGIAKTISQHTSDTNSVNGLLGNIDEDYESEYIAVERGYDVAGLFGSFTNEEEDLQGLKEYLIRTRKLVSSHPDEFFSSPKEAEINIAGLDHIIINFDDKNLREKAIQDVSSNKSLLGNVEDVNMPISDFASALGSIFKKIGKAVKKAATTVAAKAKSTAQAVAKVATKLWTGIKKVAKKVWKAIVKYNPLTIAARAGVLLAANLNLFHLGSKLFVGYTTEDEAKKLGYSSEQWKKAVAASAKASKLYTNIGGNLDKLKTASRNGAKREWKGIEMPPASTGEFISRSQSTIDSRPDLTHSAVSEYNADKAKIQASGAQIDNTLDPYKGIVTTQVETTVEVVVDKNGKELTAAEIEQAKKEGSLKGLFGIDATTAITVHGLINNGHIGNSNLGIDPVTVTIITASVGLITSILKVLADSGVGGKTMQTIAKVATVADAAAQGANDINQSVAIKKLQQTQATATPTPTLVAKEAVKKTTSSTVQNAQQAIKAVTSPGKTTTQTPASTTSKSSASEFTDFVNNATKKVETVLNTKKKVETDLNTAKKVVANALDILSPNSSSTQKQPVTPATDITIKNPVTTTNAGFPVTTTNAGFNIDKLLPWGVGLLALASIPIIYSMNSNKTENNG